ncbi:hypothetical protein, partial [Pseudoalteromonas sp.]
NIRSVIRYRLQCYAIENLLLTDQCLSVLGKTWEEFKVSATSWLEENDQHRDTQKIQELIDSPDRLVNTKIKAIRQLICSICGSGKPWEVVVGQALGTLDTSSLPNGDFDIPKFMGLDATTTLLGQ